MCKLQKKLLFVCILIYFFPIDVHGERAPKLINAQYGQASDFKYLVTIVRDSKPVCGGGIINNRFVLTAAHCVYNPITKRFKANRFKIVAATNSWYDVTTAIQVNVETVYVPEVYAQQIYEADIAVLKLKNSLELEKNPDKLQSLQLPQEGLGQFENSANYEIIFAGFGRGDVSTKIINGVTTYETSNSGWLRFAKARIIKLDECQAYWSPLYATAKHMCLRIIQDPTGQTHQGTCKGDSGSPLVVNGVIVGIDSGLDNSCNDNIKPTIFVRVSSYLTFINNAMNGFTFGMLVHQQ